jgi:hypothetical protein
MADISGIENKPVELPKARKQRIASVPEVPKDKGKLVERRGRKVTRLKFRIPHPVRILRTTSVELPWRSSINALGWLFLF